MSLEHEILEVVRPEIERILDERIAAAKLERGSPWMTSQQAAEYMGISVDALHKLVQRKRVKASRAGRRLRFHRDNLDDTLAC